MNVNLTKSYYTTASLADELSVSIHTIYSWYRLKGLRGHKEKHGKKILFYKEDVENFLNGVHDEVKIKHIHIKLRPSEYDFVKKEATNLSISMNELISRLINLEMERKGNEQARSN